MTIEQKKEQLSNRYLGILAANRGFVIEKPELDLGVDYQLKKTYTYTMPNGKTRFQYDSRYIDIQLKATTENQVIIQPGMVRYDLEAKNYNDLVERQTNGVAPLVLILFVLPDLPADWVDLHVTELRLRRNAYWYQPPAGSVQTANQNTIRIDIPIANRLDIDCCVSLHQQFYP